MRTRLRQWYDLWLRRRIPPAQRVALDRRRIFIFPTGYGFLFVTMAAMLFIGGINYENNLIMAFSFLLTSLFLMAILHTYRNLVGVVLRAGGQEPGFAGGRGSLEVVIDAGDRRWHRSLWLRWPGGHQRELSVGPGEEISMQLDLPLARRGRINPGRLRIQTRYPLGLLRAWSLVDLDHRCLAWPRPLAGGSCPASGGDSDQGQRNADNGSDDFRGLRTYVQGDSLRLVDWKAYARGQGLNTKLFSDPVEGRRWLDWDQLPELAPEYRLQRLTWWALELDRQNSPYGLVLPGVLLDPGQGPNHRRVLLETLALYGLGEDD